MGIDYHMKIIRLVNMPYNSAGDQCLFGQLARRKMSLVTQTRHCSQGFPKICRNKNKSE